MNFGLDLTWRACGWSVGVLFTWWPAPYVLLALGKVRIVLGWCR